MPIIVLRNVNKHGQIVCMHACNYERQLGAWAAEARAAWNNTAEDGVPCVVSKWHGNVYKQFEILSGSLRRSSLPAISAAELELELLQRLQRVQHHYPRLRRQHCWQHNKVLYNFFRRYLIDTLLNTRFEFSAFSALKWHQNHVWDRLVFWANS